MNVSLLIWIWAWPHRIYSHTTRISEYRNTKCLYTWTYHDLEMFRCHSRLSWPALSKRQTTTCTLYLITCNIIQFQAFTLWCGECANKATITFICMAKLSTCCYGSLFAKRKWLLFHNQASVVYIHVLPITMKCNYVEMLLNRIDIDFSGRLNFKHNSVSENRRWYNIISILSMKCASMNRF